MLNENEKVHIRLEETYRHEVRSQLAPPSRGGLWVFLNSPLGMWLLSALFVTGVGSLYTKHQEARTAAARVRESVQRLDLEIGYRFSQVQVRLHSVAQSKPSDSEGQVRRIVEAIPKPPGGDFQHLYPEYSSFGVPALVAELKRHVSDERQSRDLDKILAHLTGLPVFFEVRHAPLSDPTRVAGAIIQNLVLPRWKDADWYFLDGSSQSPFP